MGLRLVVLIKPYERNTNNKKSTMSTKLKFKVTLEFLYGSVKYPVTNTY